MFTCCHAKLMESSSLLMNSLLTFSRITLLVLPISFFAGLMSLVVIFSKVVLWSFNAIKRSSLSLNWILSRMFFLLAIFLPCSLIVVVILELACQSIIALLAYIENYSVKKFIYLLCYVGSTSNTLDNFNLTHEEWTNSTLGFHQQYPYSN